MRLRQFIFLAAILLIFAVLLGWPLVQVLGVAFLGIPAAGQPSAFTSAYLAAVFADPNLRQGLINSTMIAVCVTLLCAAISVPLAMLSVRYDFIGKRLMSGLLLVPLILPPFVGAIGMRQILGRFGVLTAIAQDVGLVPRDHPIDWFGGGARLAGVILIEALALYPILYLNVSAALANLDPALEQAAANLGASRWTIFRRITLPLMRPGLLAGGTIVLIWSFTELGTPLMFDYYDVTPVQVFHMLTQVQGSPLPYALVVVMLAASVALYLVGRTLLGRGHDAAVSKASIQSIPRMLRGARGLLALAPFVVIGGLAILPHLAVVLMSVSGIGAWYQSALPRVFTLAHYQAALSHELVLPSVQNSVTYACGSVVLDVLAGLAIAYLIVRADLPRFARQLVDGLATLPLAVPGLVLAFGYLAISLQLQTWVASYATAHHLDLHWLLSLLDVRENPTLLLILAYAMRRLPYVVRSAVAGLEQTPVDLELAARNLGASRLLTLRRVTVPLIGAHLLAGGLLAFAFAMLEVSDSLILAQKTSYYPITKAIYDLFGRLRDGPYIACALGVWAMLLLTMTLLSANALLGRKMGAMFRI
jgi:iron(III) transport system permease protein